MAGTLSLTRQRLLDGPDGRGPRQVPRRVTLHRVLGQAVLEGDGTGRAAFGQERVDAPGSGRLQTRQRVLMGQARSVPHMVECGVIVAEGAGHPRSRDTKRDDHPDRRRSTTGRVGSPGTGEEVPARGGIGGLPSVTGDPPGQDAQEPLPPGPNSFTTPAATNRAETPKL